MFLSVNRVQCVPSDALPTDPLILLYVIQHDLLWIFEIVGLDTYNVLLLIHFRLVYLESSQTSFLVTFTVIGVNDDESNNNLFRFSIFECKTFLKNYW